MWLDVAIALSIGGGGLIGGWVMHAIGGFGNYRWRKKIRSRVAACEGEEPSRERIAEVASRLRGYAVSMAADVDAHQSRVQAVNNSLSGELKTSSPEMVYDAVNKLIEANEAMQTQLQAAQDQIHDQAVQIETAERRAADGCIDPGAQPPGFRRASGQTSIDGRQPEPVHWPSWMSITSSNSMMCTGIAPATRCCGSWPRSCTPD